MYLGSIVKNIKKFLGSSRDRTSFFSVSRKLKKKNALLVFLLFAQVLSAKLPQRILLVL